MIDAIAGHTGSIVEVALDALSMQQRVHANNIANVNTNGYMAQRMEFESALHAVASSDKLQANNANEQLAQLDSRINRGELVRSSVQPGVELDVEMAGLSETVLKYQALIQGLIQYNSMAAMAIAGDVNK